MSITLDGTNGITTPDVTSTGLTADTTTLVVDDVNNRVGVGTGSPASILHASSSAVASDIISENTNTGVSASNKFGFAIREIGTEQVSLRYYRDGSAAAELAVSNHLRFTTAGSERARINSIGQLLLNTTSSIDGQMSILANASNSGCIGTGNNGLTTYYPAIFYHNGGLKGYIGVSASGTSYVNASDYRLKENVTTITGAVDRLKLLKPSRFNFIADPNTTVDGFLAHELAEAVPEAVHGEKDAVDADGKPVYQGIDQSKLVPLLTASLQEALAKIESLTARVEALEGTQP